MIHKILQKRLMNNERWSDRCKENVTKAKTRNVGQCPTWWPPCRIQVAPSVQRRKVWLTPNTRMPCSNAAKMRIPLNLQGCPKLANRSQPLVGQSSPYCGDMWRRYCCLTSFFRIVDTCLSCKYTAQWVVQWCRDGEFLAIFCGLYFQQAACTTFQTCILNLH